VKILIIDDERNICFTLQSILEDDGHEVFSAYSARSGFALFDEIDPDAVILDVKLPDGNGLDLLEKIRTSTPELPVIMISGNSNITEAVKALKIGAFDFLEKPLSLPKVKITVSKALQFNAMASQMRSIRSQNELDWAMVGESSAMRALRQIIDRVARSNAKILIQGESGTGKELVARLIHSRSDSANRPFVKFNSAAIPKELVESELFGYERGAFTGADKRKKGKLEEADGGSLFLDEIGDMDLGAQAKILRVIQEGEFERVGGNATQRIDVRVIAATNKDLPAMVSRGEFREDLFYRLNVVPIHTPALRDRKDDIPLLIDHFSHLIAGELKVKLKDFGKDALNWMKTPDYPGNVRELRNIVERIYLLCENQSLSAEDIEPHLSGSIIHAASTDEGFWNKVANFTDKKREFEVRFLSMQLRLHGNSVTRTAEALGLAQSNLSRKLHELGIL